MTEKPPIRYHCSICKRIIPERHGWTQGNNAQPINDGRCCDQCDWNVVIPARIRAMGLTTE